MTSPSLQSLMSYATPTICPSSPRHTPECVLDGEKNSAFQWACIALFMLVTFFVSDSRAQTPTAHAAVASNNASANASGEPAASSAYPEVKFITSMGDIVMELYPDKAPKTVANFLQYVKDHHYDGTVFHRVINNFMVQGGGYGANLKEKKTRNHSKNKNLEKKRKKKWKVLGLEASKICCTTVSKMRAQRPIEYTWVYLLRLFAPLSDIN